MRGFRAKGGDSIVLNVLWAAFFALAFVCGAANGRLGEVSAALTEGAAGAVTLAISIAGLMCFWSGIMEVMQQSGLTAVIARRLLPVLRPLFGKKAAEDSEAMQAVSANVTANLWGLSNAATPLGLRAASRLHKISGSEGASDAVLTLMVLNSASIQLVPSTVAAVRAACGAKAPFDIMLPVWGASAASVAVALLLCRVGRAFFSPGESGKRR